MRGLRLAFLLLVAAALSPPAGARPVPTGAGQRITRAGAPRRPHIVYVPPSENGQIELYGILADVSVGEEYDLIDQGGYVGRVKVARVERTDEQCEGFFYHKASVAVEYMARETRDVTGTVTAIGPSPVPQRRARLISEDDSRVPPAHPGWADKLQALVDLDGDGTPELARYLGPCDADSIFPICVEDWTRSFGDSWRISAQTRLTCNHY